MNDFENSTSKMANVQNEESSETFWERIYAAKTGPSGRRVNEAQTEVIHTIVAIERL